MPAPVLVQFEKEIDREMAKEGNMENGNDNDYDEEDMELIEYGPQAQIVTNDLRSLDEMVSPFICIYISTYRMSDIPADIRANSSHERLDVLRRLPMI